MPIGLSGGGVVMVQTLRVLVFELQVVGGLAWARVGFIVGVLRERLVDLAAVFDATVWDSLFFKFI